MKNPTLWHSLHAPSSLATTHSCTEQLATQAQAQADTDGHTCSQSVLSLREIELRHVLFAVRSAAVVCPRFRRTPGRRWLWQSGGCR
jgi:hypothetical protein